MVSIGSILSKACQFVTNYSGNPGFELQFICPISYVSLKRLPIVYIALRRLLYAIDSITTSENPHKSTISAGAGADFA
jgi:hypothetical protein